MLTVCTWLWGDKYSAGDVAKLAAGVRRHLAQPYRFLCITDADIAIDGVETTPIKDPGFTTMKGCFARLRLFDPVWQGDIGATGRIANLDLDAIITGPLDPLFNRPDNFVILHGGNAVNPCRFNGSVFMLRAGAHREVWDDFTLEKAKAVPFHDFPDDQGWLWHMLPNAAGWNCGRGSGVYAFQKPGWPKGDDLPADARMVVFPGWRSPEKFRHLSWVKEHWHAG